MAEVKPFRGVRYSVPAAGRLSDLIAPPYDMVDRALYERLMAASPHNVVRLTLPAGPEAHYSGAAPDESYARSAALLNTWLAAGVLQRDERPAIYLHEQRFELEGRSRARSGLVALVKLGEPGRGIRPHERTIAGPKADRLKVLRATRANLGQVFCLYEDGASEVAPLLEDAKRGAPLAQARDAEGTAHSLWALRSADQVRPIQAALARSEVFIADGHHRYETALEYMREKPDSPAAGYRMMTLVHAADPGLVVLPTHRLVRGLKEPVPEQIVRRLEAAFDLEQLPTSLSSVAEQLRAALHRERDAGRRAIGMYLPGGQCLVAAPRRHASATGSPAAELDVSLLHSAVLAQLLGMGKERLAVGQTLDYVQDFPQAIGEALARVDRGEWQALFLLNATTLEQVLAVARAGDEMPPKSTFFYPKVCTGLVMRLLEEAAGAGQAG